MLVSQAYLLGSKLKSVLSAGIYVFDFRSVRRGQLIQFVEPVANGLRVALHVGLRRKRVTDEIHQIRIVAVPIVLRCLRRYRIQSYIYALGWNSGRSHWLLCESLLREPRKGQRREQQRHYEDAKLHSNLPRG